MFTNSAQTSKFCFFDQNMKHEGANSGLKSPSRKNCSMRRAGQDSARQGRTAQGNTGPHRLTSSVLAFVFFSVDLVKPQNEAFATPSL